MCGKIGIVGAGLAPALFENVGTARRLPLPPRERIKIAFVSTNSITQGEQVGVLWSELLRLGVKIHFAHRTFQWSNEARGKAAVHCVIIGFALHDTDRKMIYDYPDIKVRLMLWQPKTSIPIWWMLTTLY